MEQLASRSFLALPKKVRCRIYYAAGLVTNGNIYLNLRQRKKPGFFHDIPDLEFSLNLLLTCRTIHEEVLHILFSTNCVHVNEPQFLSQLSVSSLSSLSSLKVYLNVVDALDCRNHRLTSRPESVPMNHTIESHLSLLEQWENTAERIGPHISPHVLKLGLICDVDNEDTARLAIKPLRHFPTLSACEIRLSHEPNSQLAGIAREAAFKALGQWPPFPSESFPFLRLSPELRLMILEYTDLVTPLSRVEWDMQAAYFILYRSCSAPFEPPFVNCHPNKHTRCAMDRDQCQICPHGRCGECFHYGCQFRTCSISEKNAYIRGCFCNRKHSAYSPYCRCWRPPRSLFLVSKELYQAAQTVFFSMNHISIYFDICSSSEAPGITRFTRALSGNALCNLRSLELTIDCPIFENLHRTFQHLNHITWSLQHLFIEIKLGTDLPSCPDLFSANQPYPRPLLANENGINIVKESVDMIWPTDHIYMPSSAIRLFIIKLTFCSEGVNYYLRRKQEPLPLSKLDVDIMDVGPSELHLERGFSVDVEGNIDSSSPVPKPGNNVWIEGIVARPDHRRNKPYTWG